MKKLESKAFLFKTFAIKHLCLHHFWFISDPFLIPSIPHEQSALQGIDSVDSQHAITLPFNLVSCCQCGVLREYSQISCYQGTVFQEYPRVSNCQCRVFPKYSYVSCCQCGVFPEYPQESCCQCAVFPENPLFQIDQDWVVSKNGCS